MCKLNINLIIIQRSSWRFNLAVYSLKYLSSNYIHLHVMKINSVQTFHSLCSFCQVGTAFMVQICYLKNPPIHIHSSSKAHRTISGTAIGG